MDLTTLNKLTVKELKNILGQLNEKTTGTKSELLTRLSKYEFEELQKAAESVSTGSQIEQDDDGDVGKLRDDVGALQRSMEVLTQQLATVIHLSTQLQHENVRLTKEIAHPIPVVSIPVSVTESAIVTVVGGNKTTQTDVSSNFLAFSPPTQLQMTAQDDRQNSIIQSSRSNNKMTNALSLPLFATQYVATTTPTTYTPNVHFTENIPVSPVSGGVNRGASDLFFGSRNENYTQVSAARQTELPSVQYSNIRDLLYVMPEFDPCVGSISSMQFVERIEQLINVYQWSETSVLFAVQCKMKGAAKLWVDAQNVFRSWSDFVTVFLSDFPCVINTADVHRQMMQTRMTKGETTIEFYYKVLSLGRRGCLDDNAIKSYVINGLFDDGLRRMLSATTFNKCSDLLNTLIRVCASEGPYAGAPRSAPIFQPQTMERPSGPMCYNCRERGHVSRNCMQTQRKPRCEKCSTTTHETKNCPYLNRAPVNVIENNFRQEKETLKEIDIKGVKCLALIDSGSCSSLIIRNLAQNFVNYMAPCDKNLFGFAGGEFKCREMLCLPITIDGRDYESELMIVDDDIMAYDVLIGTDILCKGRVIIENGKCNVVALDNTKIDIGNQLSADEKHQIFELLNSFSDCFGENLKELGKCASVKMEIRLTSDKPIEKKPYAIPFPKQQSVNRIVQELLDLNIIRPASSSYASPIVLVKKQNGEERLCVDYRELNAITEKRPWSMPTVEEVLVAMAGMLIFCVCNGKPLMQYDNNYDVFRKHVAQPNHFSCKSMENTPYSDLKTIVESLLHKTPTCRPKLTEIIQCKPFQDLGVKTLNYLDTICQWDNYQKSKFYKGLLQIIPNFPHRVNLHTVISHLVKEFINTAMVPFVLPNILLIAKMSTQQEYIEYILPHLDLVFNIYDPIQIPLIIMEQMDVLIKLTPADKIKTNLLLLLNKSLEFEMTELQQLGLQVLPLLLTSIDYTTLKNSLLPRLKNLCLKTNDISIKVKCLICIGKLLEYLDKWVLISDILPFIEKIKNREPAVIMAIIGIFKLSMTTPKLGISTEIMAGKCIPLLMPLCMENTLTVSQFNLVTSIIKEMFEKVEKEQRIQLEQLSRTNPKLSDTCDQTLGAFSDLSQNCKSSKQWPEEKIQKMKLDVFDTSKNNKNPLVLNKQLTTTACETDYCPNYTESTNTSINYIYPSQINFLEHSKSTNSTNCSNALSSTNHSSNSEKSNLILLTQQDIIHFLK